MSGEKKSNKNIRPEQETVCETGDIDTKAGIAEEETDQLELMRAELDEQKDLFLRKIAEFDNFRKRTARETERIGIESRAATLKTFLPAVDNFKRALSAPESSYEDYRKGIELSIKQFLELLQKMGLEEINPENQAFDPDYHYAVSKIESDGFSKNTVAQVLQSGYKIGDIVIRPAMVSVANCE